MDMVTISAWGYGMSTSQLHVPTTEFGLHVYLHVYLHANICDPFSNMAKSSY